MSSRRVDERLARKAPWLLAMLAVGVAAPRVVGNVLGADAVGTSVFTALVGMLSATAITSAMWFYPAVRRPRDRRRIVLGAVPIVIAAVAVIALPHSQRYDIDLYVCCSPCILVGVLVPAVTLATAWARRGLVDGLGPHRVVVAMATIWFTGVWLTTLASGTWFEPVDCGFSEVRVGTQEQCVAQSARIVRFFAAVFAASAAGVSIALRGRARWDRSLLPLAGLAIWFAAQAGVEALHLEVARAVCADPSAAGDAGGLVSARHVVELGGVSLALIAWSCAGILAFSSPRRDGALRGQWRAVWPLVPALLLASSAPSAFDERGEWVVPPLAPTLACLIAALATLVLFALVFVRELRRADRRCAGAVEAAPNPQARVIPSWVHWQLATMRQPRERHPYRTTLDAREIALVPRAALWTMIGRIARIGTWRALRAALIWAGLALAQCLAWALLFIAWR